MSGKPKKIAFGYGGVVITSISEGSSSKKMSNKAITSSGGSSSKRVLNKATELNSSSRMIFKDKHTSCAHLVSSSMTRYWRIPQSSRPKSSSRNCLSQQECLKQASLNLTDSKEVENKMAEHRIGYIGVVTPSSKGSSSKRMANESSEMQSSSRMIYKDNYSGCSSKFTEQHKAEEFVDKHSGRLGYKEELKYTSTNKLNDKVQGYTTEYETQVKFKKTVYPNKSASKYNNKGIDYY
ncbi:hypothetical protein CFP56_007051 [Quercus suber]|uniref:Uncharacterized protein n=1 Tax=Quercus suber TaxID=58331 RepID=A0AAW0L7E0_QUESU